MDQSNQERWLLIRLQNQEHSKSCQEQQISLADCLCFQAELQKILSTKNISSKKRKKKNNIHWENYLCGTKNRKTTKNLHEVTCSHCKNSAAFRILLK